MRIRKIFRNEDSLDDFDNRRRVSPNSKYITFSGLAKNDVRDGVKNALNKKNILNASLGESGPRDFRFAFIVRNKETDVRDALTGLNSLGERNTWFIQYKDGDSIANRISDFSPDIPNDLWYSGGMDKIVDFIMPKKGKAEASSGAIELGTPSFKPREYEGEKIEYLVYGLDDEGTEIECIDGPVDTPDSAAELAGGILKKFPGLYFHVTAVLNDENGKMKDSEVVWSNFPEEESKKDETIEFEKGHKDSKGEDAPWVIRAHKGGKVLASFAKKADAEAHLERMKRYSKDEAAGSIVADNRLGKIVKARLRDNVLAFLPIDDDGKNDDCTYFFKVDGNNIITKGYHWGRDEIDRSMIADDGYPWTAEPNRPTRDWVHTEEYAKYLLDRVRKCLDMGVATRKSEVADSAGFSKFVKNLLDAAINMFDDATWDRLVKDYDFGDDFEKGRSVADSLKNMQGWVLATEKKHTDEKLFNKKDLENYAMTGYKAAVNSAWSGAGVKNFKIDFGKTSGKALAILPKTLDRVPLDVDWVIFPSRGMVAQYATDNYGASEIEREIPFKTEDDIEKIFTDEFKSLDDVLEHGKPSESATQNKREAPAKNEEDDLRDYYLDVWMGLVKDHKMSAEKADRLCDKYQQIIINGYEEGEGPVKISDQLATQDKRESQDPGTKWSAGIRVSFNGENDPNDKWAKDYKGQSIWNFFDDLSDVLPPREAMKRVPERYKDAFKDYCAYYGMACPDESSNQGNTANA